MKRIISGYRGSKWAGKRRSLACRSVAHDLPLEISVQLPFTPEFEQHFLRNYWQKRPLLLRGAFGDGFVSPVEDDELAALACEEGALSRLCLRSDSEGPAGSEWSLQEGPFTDATFEQLPATGWQLLVNGVDRHVPEVADLLDRVPCVPRWRIDDVMVTFAAPGGGVGPHSDSYDVLLLQGSGHKRWSVSVNTRYDPNDPDVHLEDCDMRVLKDFCAEVSWVLGPGDMLYVPPHIGHEGTALDEGQTLSIGFLAPRACDVVAAYAADAAASMDASLRYVDPAGMPAQVHAGQIAASSVAQLTAVLESMPRDHDSVAAWMGRLVTTPRGLPEACPVDTPYTVEEFQRQVQEGDLLCRHESTRMAFAELQDGSLTLFVDGFEYTSGVGGQTPRADLLRCLTQQSRLTQIEAALAQDVGGWDLLVDLANEGYLYFLSERGE